MTHDQRNFLAKIVVATDDSCKTIITTKPEFKHVCHQIITANGDMFSIYENKVNVGERIASKKQMEILDTFLKDQAYSIAERLKSIVFNYEITKEKSNDK